MRGCRKTAIGWEGKCDECREWWPLDDPQSWLPKHGMRTCRACWREQQRLRIARMRQDPEVRARHRDAHRENFLAKKRADPEYYAESRRKWWAKNAERINAERAERYAIQLELEGRKPTRKLIREETPETLAIRREYRQRWIREHGLVIGSRKPVDLDARRAYKREWMRRKRAEGKVA